MIARIDLVRQRMILALFIRLLMLLFIVLLENKMPALGFIGNSPDYDDYRYEQGAVMYAEEAERCIDVKSFTRIYDSMGDWTGHHLSSPLTEGFLWYWIVCLLVYFSKSRWYIRLLNIFLSVFITKYIYNLSEILFTKSTAKLASLLYAVFPYTVIFSCFSYKDTLVSFCIFYIALFFAEAKHGVKHSRKKIISLMLVCMIFLLVRSGVSEIFIALCLFYYFFEIAEHMRAKRILIVFGLTVTAIVFATITLNLILYKYNAYIGGATTQGLGGGALVKVTGLKDIWKIPFTYIFSILQPIVFTGQIDSWVAVVSRFNIFMCPIAIASVMEILLRKRVDRKLSFVFLSFYLICCIPSVLVFRQLYSIWPIPLMYGCNYMANGKCENKIVVTLMSAVLAVVAIYAFR